MLRGISDESRTIRNRCAATLRTMGPECMPHLKRAFAARETSDEARDAMYKIACHIAKKSKDPDAVEFVATQARNEKNGAAMIGIVKEVADPAIPGLLNSLGSENAETRAAAAHALGKIVKDRPVDARAAQMSGRMAGEIVEPPSKYMRRESGRIRRDQIKVR